MTLKKIANKSKALKTVGIKEVVLDYGCCYYCHLGRLDDLLPMSSWKRLRGESPETSIIHSVYTVSCFVGLLAEVNVQ